MSPVFSALSILLLISSVRAQATTVPQCALGCARQQATKVGCSLPDTSCLCHATSFVSATEQCVRTTSCSAAEQAVVSNILGSMCAAIPPSSSESSILPSSPSSALPTSSGTSATNSATNSASMIPSRSASISSAASITSSSSTSPSSPTTPSSSSPSQTPSSAAADAQAFKVAKIAAGAMLVVGIAML